MGDLQAATERLKAAQEAHSKERDDRQRRADDLQECLVDTRAQKEQVRNARTAAAQTWRHTNCYSQLSTKSKTYDWENWKCPASHVPFFSRHFKVLTNCSNNSTGTLHVRLAAPVTFAAHRPGALFAPQSNWTKTGDDPPIGQLAHRHIKNICLVKSCFCCCCDLDFASLSTDGWRWQQQQQQCRTKSYSVVQCHTTFVVDHPLCQESLFHFP